MSLILAGDGTSSNARMMVSGKTGCVDSNHSAGPSPNDGDLFEKLWQLCAGQQFYIPKAGERVLYFPQGHIEQDQACTNLDSETEMQMYNVPSMISCKVLHVSLKVSARTDEVFAQITLLPEKTQDEPVWSSYKWNDSPPVRQRFHGSFFDKCKTLTQSDASSHGGFAIPKGLVDECFPPLDMSMEIPAQELVMKDLRGNEWHFHHTYRGQSKKHLITTGWNAFVAAKKLVPNDTCIFLRGENRELRVGVRRSMESRKRKSTAVMSGHNMHHRILESAFHATSTGTMFTVSCHPWRCSSPFIIPDGQYMKSIHHGISPSTRFRMLFENEECVVRRFEGTVVKVEDVDHIRWPGSKWRCLKVKWDYPMKIHKHPERVSPWNIELIEPAKRKKISAPSPEKRARPPDLSSPGTSKSVKSVKGRTGVKEENDGTTEKPSSNESRKFRLFGVDIHAPIELPSLQAANSGGLHSPPQSCDPDVPGQSKRIPSGGSPIAFKSCIKGCSYPSHNGCSLH